MRFTQVAAAVLATFIITSCGGGGGGNGGGGGGGSNPPPLAAGEFDPFADYGTFLNVLTPGQADCPSGGSTTMMSCPDNFTDQQIMYESLAFTQPGQLQTVADLVPAFYKTSAFVPADGAPVVDGGKNNAFVTGDERTVTDGTRSSVIKRDLWGVPYIYGETRADVMFGTGYATASDRMFLMDALRHVGRGRQADFTGGAPPDAYDRELGIKAGYDEAELQAQIDQLDQRFGAEGVQVQEDAADFVAGVNAHIAGIAAGDEEEPAEYALLSITLRDFTPRDVVAIATLVQAIFAVGGGNEVQQVQLLHELLDQAGGDTAAACALWRDLRHADDPEKPTTADIEFKTQSPPVIDETACPFAADFAAKFPGAVLFDRGSLVRRDPLTVANCSSPAPPPPAPAPPGSCPDFQGSVVDDTPPATASAKSGPLPLAAAAPAIPRLDFSRLGRAALEPVYRVLRRPAGVQRAGYGPYPLRVSRPAPKRELARRAAREKFDGIVTALAQMRRQASMPSSMSNALLVAKDQTASGHPIAVFGPQTGYRAPQLLLELNQLGGDIASRGMTFAGVPYVLIGRGVDYAWSATSSGDDIIDTRVLKLCNADGTAATASSTGYLYKGACKPLLVREDRWTAEFNPGAPPSGPGIGLAVTRRILRAPDYGPVFATATVNAEPVALVTQRSTFFGEVDSAIPFVRTSRNDVHDPQSFNEAFNRLTGTFNWFYVDSDDIAYFNSGLLPVRAAGVHPDLPAWGDGNHDWKQKNTGTANPSFSLGNFLPLDAHPRQANPAKGYMTSWNNAQAPGFWAAEHQSSYGPVHRSLMLDARLKAFQAAGLQHTPASVVEIMEDAGATDLRGQEVLPSVFAVLSSSGPALTAAQATAVNKLKAWVADGTRGFGAQRRDRDGPGQDPTALSYKDRDSVILMDRWWNTMIEDALPQVFELESTVNGNVMIEIRHDAPGPVGSAFIQGYYGYMRRTLDMALGTSAHPYQALKCAGTGVLADCRAALVTSLQRALDMTAAVRPEEYDAIDHVAAGAAGIPLIHWINRPTWQQVVEPTQARQPKPASP